MQQDEPRHQRHDTDQHDQRVVIDVAGLTQTHDRGDHVDNLGRSVDRDAVDDGFVATLPQAAADQACAGGKHLLVEPVEVVLVLHHLDQRGQHTGQGGGDGRSNHVEHEGRDASQGGQHENHGDDGEEDFLDHNYFRKKDFFLVDLGRGAAAPEKNRSTMRSAIARSSGV